MKNFAKLAVTVLLLSQNLLADEVEIPISSSLANTEGMVNSIVADHVCVITGDYVDSEIDLVVHSPEPLLVRRSYCSSDLFHENFLRMGWKLGEPDILVAKLADGGTIASAKTAHGAHVKYSGYFHRNKSEPIVNNNEFLI
jgi:hypothetical protein